MERYERNVNLESLLLQWNLPDIEKNKEETRQTRQECQNDDLLEKSSDPFGMRELSCEVSAIDRKNLREDNLIDISNGGSESRSDSDEQKVAEAFSGVEEENQKIVDYPDSSDNEGEELFMSDSDSELKDAGGSDQTELNPCVPEFVPLASRDNSPLTLPYSLEDGKEDWEKVSADWQGMGGLLRGLRKEAGQVGCKSV